MRDDPTNPERLIEHLNGVADLVEELRTGIPSSRLDSPVYAQTDRAPVPQGRRHQTDAERPQTGHVRPSMAR